MDKAIAGGTAGPGDRAARGGHREEFFNTMIGSLCETIESVVGMEDAETFIGIVGRRVGQSEAARLDPADACTPADVAEHLQNFKQAIGGDFRVDSVEGSKIVFSNHRCPFAKQAAGRPSLCMMTTNVFGRVAADATGYARVNVREALARGDSRCLVSVDLEWDPEGDGQEFFG